MLCRTLRWWCTLFLFFSTGLQAQNASNAERLDLDSPEGWAMAHTLSSTLNLGHGPPQPLAPLQFELWAELGTIPHIRSNDTRVGFGGFKQEDLNKSPVFGRGTFHLGLPAGVVLALSWTPPLQISGVKPENLFGIALETQLLERGEWQLGARLFAQTGDAKGDITCSSQVASHPPGSAANPFGCREKSRDSIQLDHHGVEILVSHTLSERWQPYAAVAVTKIRPQVSVRARVFDTLDHSELRTSGTLTTTTLGTTYKLSDQWGLAAAASYTPLDVRRPPARQRRNHDFWSIRLGVSWHGY